MAVARLAEQHQSFIILAASPLVWAAHFMLCYVTAAVWCAKQESPLVSLMTVRTAIGIYSVAALGAIAIIWWVGYRAHSLGAASAPHDDDSPEDRHRFIGFATVLLSGLSALGVVYAALVAVFIESCQ
jgi:hypothetical protein